MRFLRLDLKAFGPFEDVALDFEPDVAGLHFVYGANEAGKSSLLRALQALLFGIPVQTGDAFRHGMKKLRLGATLRHADGSTLTFWRRKARLASLFDADDAEPIPDDSLDRFLGGIDRDLFATMFGLTQESLVRGGQDILQGKGQLGPMLFAAGSGIADIRAVQEGLRSEWEELFKAAGRTQTIHRRVAELTEARKEVQERELSLEAWTLRDEAHRDAWRRREELRQSLDAQRRRRQSLTRWRDALPMLARLAELEAEEAADGDGAALAPDFAERRAAAETALQLAQQRLGDAGRRRADLERQLAEAPPPSDLLGVQDAIEAMHRRLDDVRRQRRQRQLAAAELLAIEASLAGADAETDDSAWSEDETRLLRDLGQRFGRLAADAEHRQRRLAELEAALADVRRQREAASGDAEERAAASALREAELAEIDRQARDLETPQAPADEDALLDARARRDAAWRRLAAAIERQAQAELPGAASDVARLVTEADAIADRLRFAGKRAERRAELAARAAEVRGALDQLRKEQTRREETQRRESSLRETILQAREAWQAAQEALLDWRARWQPLMPRLRLDPQADPAEAFAALDAMRARSERRRQAMEWTARLESIDRELGEFTAEAETLVRGLSGFSDVPSDALPEAALHDVYRRLKEARTEAESAAAKRRQLDETVRQEKAAAQAFEHAQSAMETLRQEANAPCVADLPRLEQRSAQRRRRREEFSRLRQQLDRLRDGASLETFREESEAVGADEWDRRLAESAAAIEKDSERLQELDRTIGRLQGELGRIDGAAAAAESAQRAELLASQLQGETERFAVLRMAYGLLQDAVEAWRQKSEDGIVRDAIELFRRLTCGSFEGLEIDPDDKGQSIVYGVRAGDRSRVAVEAMSDGSRDQLYLALRLASLDAYLQDHPPIPLVVDDLLLHFDDERALAAMRALCDLSKRTQVLFFTHHRHLLELASRHLPTKRVFFHELGARQASSALELF